MNRKTIIVKYICILSLLISYPCGLYAQSLEYIFEPKRETDWTGYIAKNSLGYYHNGPNIKFGRESSILNNRYRGWAVFDLNPFYSQFPTDNIIITNVDLIIYINTKGNNSTYLEIKGLRSFDPKSGSNISIYDAVGNSITYKTDLSYLFPVGEGEREIGALGSAANLDFQNALQNHLNEFYVGLKAQDEESYDTDVELDGYNHTYLLENDPMPKLKVTWEYKNITVYTPNNSSFWQVGTTQNIIWEDNISENVKIELFQGSTLVFPIATSTASDGNHPWPIPTSLSNGSYKIK
ncbi:MAG: hypothetical protein JXB49_02450, partial [Bacteroidales bacterium]|nr:hypothetical protein [Bacteroidales bacterium]